MTERELKGYLESIKVLSEKRDKKLEQIDELRSVATNCVAPTDKEPIQSSGSADKMANIVGRMVDLIREVDELDEIIRDRKSIIYRLSDKLPTDRHSQYIKLRFLEKNGFYDTVMKMELTDSTARRIERKAISELTRIMNTAEYNI
jgi:predicted transcriptional regulator